MKKENLAVGEEPAFTKTDPQISQENNQMAVMAGEQENNTGGAIPSEGVQISLRNLGLYEESPPESLSYIGLDSTSVTEITMSSNDTEDSEDLDKWLEDAKKCFGKGEANNRAAAIGSGISLIRRLADKANRRLNEVLRNNAETAIHIGKICNLLKKIVKASGYQWESWAEENISFIDQRNRQKYGLLARRKDCHAHTYLGVDRLEMLCSVTTDLNKDSSVDDPIGTLMANYDIGFDENSEVNLSEFKKEVDAAIVSKKLKKRGIDDLDHKLVLKAIKGGVSLDAGEMRKLIEIKEANGNPTKHIENLILNGGKRGTKEQDNMKPQDFNTMSVRFSETISEILKNEDLQDHVDHEMVKNVMKWLNELAQALNLIPEENKE